MKQRIITAIFILLGLVGIVWVSATPASVIYPIAVGALCLIGSFEMLRVEGKHRDLPVAIPVYLLSAALPVLSYFIMRRADYLIFIVGGVFVLFLLMLYLFALSVFTLGREDYRTICSVYATSFYIIASFSSLVILRYLPEGLYNVLIVFIGAWVCDVFAYFTGFFFGKHKLIPAVSPKKTVEGSVGGIVFALIAMELYGFVLSRFTDLSVNYGVLAFLGVLLPVISQIGDLFASVVKRTHGVKDYGTLFPGHGGVMDRFDSILAVCAPAMIVALIFPPFR